MLVGQDDQYTEYTVYIVYIVYIVYNTRKLTVSVSAMIPQRQGRS